MDLVQSYDGSDSDDDGIEPFVPVGSKSSLALSLPPVNLAPAVVGVDFTKQNVVAVANPETNELTTNPKYDALFRPEVCVEYVCPAT